MHFLVIWIKHDQNYICDDISLLARSDIVLGVAVDDWMHDEMNCCANISYIFEGFFFNFEIRPKLFWTISKHSIQMGYNYKSYSLFIMVNDWPQDGTIDAFYENSLFKGFIITITYKGAI